MGAGLVLIAATACAGPGTTGGQPASGPPARSGVSPPADGATTVPPGSAESQPSNPPGRPKQVVPEGSVAVPAGQIDVTALPDGYPREVSASNGDTVLSITAEEGGCGHISAAAVEQTARRVVVQLTQTRGQADQMCPMHVRDITVTVTLSAPLGRRTVVLEPAPRPR